MLIQMGLLTSVSVVVGECWSSVLVECGKCDVVRIVFPKSSFWAGAGAGGVSRSVQDFNRICMELDADDVTFISSRWSLRCASRRPSASVCWGSVLRQMGHWTHLAKWTAEKLLGSAVAGSVWYHVGHV